MQDGSSSSSTEKQAQQQGDQHHQATAMDDFLDNIISIPSWSEASGLKAHWDCNPAAATASSGDFAVDSAPSKLLKSSFAVTEQQQHQFSSISSLQALPDTALLHNVAALSHVLGSRGSLPPPIDLPRSLSEGSEPQELTAAAWCQQYTQLDLHQSNQSGRLVSSERAPVFGNTAQTRVSGQQQTTNNPSSTSAKPRVRARRGQATDPHSIAERLRRERIAERMKALQELVPNANKTDKASMLDEIIEYVKFLQLQVKVLSMSRLGAASLVSPLIADLPPTSSEGIQANTVPSTEAGGFCLSERQVARLMEEDMGSAMQYLQSKGLCLMPITLASAISSPSSRASSSMTTTPTAAAGSSPQHQSESSK